MAPSPKVAAALEQVAASPADQRPSGYESLLGEIKTLSSPSTATQDIISVADAFLEASLGHVATRSLLTTLVSTLTALGNAELRLAVGAHVLDWLEATRGAATSFLEQGAAIRELMASAHEDNEDYAAAARVLAEIPLDSSQRKASTDEMARVWVRVVRNYLEVDDTASAEGYVNKLRNIMHTVSDAELNLHFQLSQARIQDARRDFIGAARRYHDISLSTVITEEERLHTLSMAIKCAVLSPAGPLRSRVLGRLYRDERAAGLPEFGILEKMFFDRLLSPAEVDKFALTLLPHQLAVTSDGSTVLARAVIEHNLLGASRLYRNIGFDALGVLLGLDGAKAEETTARMIEQGRLVGRMDQISRIIYFEKGEASAVRGSGGAESLVGAEMRQWDLNVRDLAEEVENVTNALQKELPDFVAAHLVA